MSQISDAIDEILGWLEPLRSAGVVCRQLSETAGNAGILAPKASVAVIYTGDADFEYMDRGGSAEHAYASEFLFMGRVNQLFGSDGLYQVRDFLYKLVVGRRLVGYSGKMMPTQFQLTGQEQGRTETYWGFNLFISVQGFRKECFDSDRLDEIDAIEGIEDDIALLSAIFEADVQQNQVDVYAGSPKYSGLNPCPDEES